MKRYGILPVAVMTFVALGGVAHAQTDAISDATASRRIEYERRLAATEAACPGTAASRQKLAEISNARLQASSLQPPSLPLLRDELLLMVERDQAARRALTQAFKDTHGHPDLSAHLAVQRIDTQNFTRLEALINQYGFPTMEMVGSDGVNAVFLLVQHATANPSFQSRMLELVTIPLAQGDIRPDQFALLWDRVQIRQGKPQRYGTQSRIADGRKVLLPVEDPELVDTLRAEIGLPSLALSACIDEQQSGIPSDLPARHPAASPDVTPPSEPR